MPRFPSMPAWSTPSASEIGRATSELQSLRHLVCRLLLEKKKMITIDVPHDINEGPEGVFLVELFAPPCADWAGLERLEPGDPTGFLPGRLHRGRIARVTTPQP